jgi:hypothetical protein
MGLTISDYSNVLKLWYKGPIIDLLTNRRILLQHIKRQVGGTRFHGNEVRIPLHTGRNEGIGAREEDQALPTAGKQSHAQAVYHVMHNYARIRLTGPVMDASDDNIGAFADALDVEMSGALRDAQEDQQRQVWHDGSGVLTVCGVTSAAQTVVVASTKYLKVGMVVDIKDTDDGTAVTNGTGITIATIASATTFTITSTPITTAATDSVYRAGVRGGTFATKTELWGMEALIAADDAAKTNNGLSYQVGKVARATYPSYAGQTVAWGADFTTTDNGFGAMDTAFDKAAEEADGEANIILTSYAGKRAYAKLFDANRRYGNTMRLKGGYTGIEYNGIGVFADRDATLTANPTPSAFLKLYFLNLNDFTYYVRREWDWLDQGGAILHWVTNYDAYEAVLRSRMELAIERPNRQCALTVDSWTDS